MRRQKTQESEEQPSETKELLKEEAEVAAKDAGLGLLNAARRFGHGVVSILGRHKKVQDLQDEVEEHREKIQESMEELEE